jgi:hypothetical protein
VNAIPRNTIDIGRNDLIFMQYRQSLKDMNRNTPYEEFPSQAYFSDRHPTGKFSILLAKANFSKGKE